jgi:hypothetical protein
MITYLDGFVKLAFRLNKSATNDYGNIDKDVATEVINKAINDLVRRSISGKNQTREGAEETRLRVDDLQVLLKTRKLSLSKAEIFSDSAKLPKDYRYFNRFSFFITNKCKDNILIPSDLREESNVDILLTNDETKPSLKFEQSFHTIINNSIRLYHNNEFNPIEGTLTYFKSPKLYEANSPDEVFEFKDDIVEVIIDEAAKILAGDTESSNQYQILQTAVEQRI